MMRIFLIANALLLLPAAAWGQKERADIRQGNRAYYESKYPEADGDLLQPGQYLCQTAEVRRGDRGLQKCVAADAGR